VDAAKDGAEARFLLLPRTIVCDTPVRFSHRDSFL
jgi:hypothetical protein